MQTARQHPSGAEVFDSGWCAGIVPEPELLVSEWARRNRILTRIESPSFPGPFRPELTPYVIEPMDCLSRSSGIRKLVLVCASQMIKSTICLTFAGYAMDTWPGPILIVQPTLGMVKRFSKQRVDQMIAASPSLRVKVRPPKSRDSANTVQSKEYDGGILMMAPAGSAAELASAPILHLICDERDRWRDELRKEGDPGEIVDARTANTSGKIVICSSPTTKGFSPIWRELEDTDHRKYFIPCPQCGNMDTIELERRIKWDKDRPETAHLLCLSCGAKIPEHAKSWFLPRGEWRPTIEHPMDPEARGYHLNALYSPIGLGRSWARIARKFLQTKSQPARLKVFINTVLAELYEERGQGFDHDVVLTRKEQYFPDDSTGFDVPVGVGILVAAVDVQDTWLEALVIGFGAGEESWVIAHSQFQGSPAENAVFNDLDQFLLQEFTHESGRKMRAECVAVDTGGHHSERVYQFCAARLSRRVFAIRGGNEVGKPLVSAPTRNNAYRTPLFTLCTDTGKETVYSRLAIPPAVPGEMASVPGRMHFPGWIDQEFAAQLCAEKGIWKTIPGRGRVRKWTPTRDRNEILDLTVYCLAALHILGQALIHSLGQRALDLVRDSNDVDPATEADHDAEPAPAPPPRSSWVSGWRG